MECPEEAARVAAQLAHYRERVMTLEIQVAALERSKRAALRRAEASEKQVADMQIERARLCKVT